MKTIRLWLSYVLEPVFRFGLHVLLRLMGYSRLRIGSLTFWGSPEFLASCESAVHRLQELDSDLHSILTSRQRLVFHYSPKHLHQMQMTSLWYFSINESCTSWQTDGIIARLVYAARLAASGRPRIVMKSERPAARALHAMVCAQTSAWLAVRSFPEPLVNCFREKSFDTA
jgi:hypothetical protein